MDISTNTNQGAPAARVHRESAAEHLGFGRPSVASKILVVVLIIASLVAITWMSVSLLSGPKNSAGAIKSGKYQALFLTNGQVYFGKLSSTDNSWVKLTDIYYLQVQQQVQPTDNKKTDSSQPQVSLAKLGNELHGPEDVMYIDRSQVLFWENIKDDGKVVTAIKDYQKNGSK